MAAMSRLLDEVPEIVDLVYRDLTAGTSSGAGRQGMTAEQVFRCAVLKHLHGFTYEELELFLQDSWSMRAFARLRPEQEPTDTTLQANIARIRPETWEAINGLLVKLAQEKAIEKGRKVRIDTTVVETDIHPPTDASLLWDGIRVLTRLLEEGQALRPAPRYRFANHLRVAKKRLLAIRNSRSDEARLQPYRDMVEIALKVAGYTQEALGVLQAWTGENETQRRHGTWIAQEMRRVLELLLRVIHQTRRRVFNGEAVPAQEKIVSLFEEHTDILAKSRRETQFGHKVCRVTGASSMVLDCVIERGNLADSDLFARMLERQEALYGRPPRQSAADGGFASKANLAAAKEKGVRDVCFAKKRGLRLAAMAKSPWVYRLLKNFRAGIEANISVLKRAFGLDCCTWSGWRGFLAYVWSAIIAYNLTILVRGILA
jgi:IS5 family transposase